MLDSAGFSFRNTEEIAREINVPFSRAQAVAKQKFCNVCHAGCLDCHYAPDREKGVHHFTAKPSSESCMGYGRGTSACHPGSMHSRRGETYIGGDYSIPTGMKPDVHYKKNIHCAECHLTGEKGMGDMHRKATCQDCHTGIEEAHSRSIHRKLDCASCHVNELRGYQIVVWGPGLVAGERNPFKKYSLYYGVQSPPILMKDQRGTWMPVKAFPHSVGNIKPEVKPWESVRFRWPGGETRDPYYIVGTVETEANNRHLLWIEFQQASHPYGKGRTCGSCHKDRQTAVSSWEYMDDQGAKESFSGGYRIEADDRGLRILDMKNTTPIVPEEGYRLEDFASWVFFRDKWRMPGDFAIRAEKKKYDDYLALAGRAEKELAAVEKSLKGADKRTLRRFKEVKGAALHNEDEAAQLIRAFRTDR